MAVPSKGKTKPASKPKASPNTWQMPPANSLNPSSPGQANAMKWMNNQPKVQPASIATGPARIGSQLYSKSKPKLSSWEKEYGVRLVPTQTRQGPGGTVWYDEARGIWLQGDGPAWQKTGGNQRAAQRQMSKKRNRAADNSGYNAAPNRNEGGGTPPNRP